MVVIHCTAGLGTRESSAGLIDIRSFDRWLSAVLMVFLEGSMDPQVSTAGILKDMPELVDVHVRPSLQLLVGDGRQV